MFRFYKLGSFIIVFLCLLLLCCIVSASDISPEEIASYSQGTEVIVDDVSAPEDVQSDQTADPVYTEENPLYVSVTTDTGLLNITDSDPVSDVTDYSVSLMADAPIEASDTSGLKSVLLGILGPYEPILFEYSYGSSGYGREVFQDDVWLCSFWLFAIMVYCIFRMIGGWLLRKR